MTKQSLEADVADLVALLQRHGADHWARTYAGALRRIEAGDPVGLDHVLRAYGGMGSVNDLLLHPVNGHDIALEEVAAANDRLVALVSRTYSEAHELRRELRRAERGDR